MNIELDDRLVEWIIEKQEQNQLRPYHQSQIQSFISEYVNRIIRNDIYDWIERDVKSQEIREMNRTNEDYDHYLSGL